MKQKQKRDTWPQSAAQDLTKINFLYVAAYMLSIVVFDSWNLISHESVARRWTAAGLLLIANTVLWFVARMKLPSPGAYKLIIIALIAVDILFASINVYWERGMASLSVALYAVPIVMATALKSRGALWASATLSTAAYSTAAVRYFFDNYGEGFRVQLYGTVGFYSAIFFILAGLLIVITRPTRKSL